VATTVSAAVPAAVPAATVPAPHAAAEVVIAVAGPRTVSPDRVVSGEALANQPASNSAPDLSGLGVRNPLELHRLRNQLRGVGQVTRAEVNMTGAGADDRASKGGELSADPAELEDAAEVETDSPPHVLWCKGAVDPNLARVRVFVGCRGIDIAVVL